ncbi:hypothetical protein V5O48_009055 [Marasmius crinis-equi]|uniref:Nephrocystin 3-like N-terminal domain-containing protein n=1 Tax=Marasmius crinis-equi TaxID=585013 RepID=A0ABR3FC95_9AGAR
MAMKESSIGSDILNERAQSVNRNHGRDMNFNTGGGSLNTYNVGGDLVQSFTSAVFNPHKTLWDMVAGVKASHKSDLQFERGYCLPGTREAVLEDLHNWRLPENGGPPVCWLSGPAGVGKSAVALTLARVCEGDGLAGSFFFLRSDPKRNNPSGLILTIAHGLVVTKPGIGRLINRRIAADPRILEASLEEQYRELILRPLKEKKRWWSRLKDSWSISRNPSTRRRPNLVIIDGLDECGDRKTQTRVLSVLFSSFAGWSTNNPPLRFLVCSRPESWIREAFESSQFRRLTKRVILDNSFSAKKDIEHYFFQSFREIRESDQYAHVDFPDPWPAHYIIELLVDKASGQFIYAVTVIRFIKDDFAHPFNQLRVVLDAPCSPLSKSPFHELDTLYHVVLSANPNHKQLSLFLAAILLLPQHASPAFLDMLFELRSGATSLAFRAMHSVLDIRGVNDPISVYHTSFTDFLKDESRSERFFIDVFGQRTSLIRRWGRDLLKRRKNSLRDDHHPSGRFPWTAWADFCLESPSDQAAHKLDWFYTTILSACSHHDVVVSILAAVMLLPATTPVTPQYIEVFLEYTPSQATRALYEVDWLLTGGPEEGLTLAHMSLTAFLLDQSRSGQFFIDRNCHRDYFVRQWLRAHHIVSEFKGTLPLRSWHAFCSELDTHRDTVFVELRKFYQDLWDLKRDKWFSVIATIEALSPYAEPSLKFIDLLHKTSEDHEMYYYLHIGEEGPNSQGQPLYGLTDNYPRFFDFLEEKRRSLDSFSPPPDHLEFLARRMVEFEPGSPQRFLWDTWSEICCAVDQPSEELLCALKDLLCDAVFRASTRVVDRSGIPLRPYAPLSLEKINTQFHLKLHPFENNSVALDLAIQAILDITDCKYKVSLSNLRITHPEHSDYAEHITSTGCYCSKSSAIAPDLFPTFISFSSVINREDWHVDIQTGCRKIARALAFDLRSANNSVERLAVVLNVLDSSLLPHCGPEPNLLPLYRAVLGTAKRLNRPMEDSVSDYHRNKSVSWLEETNDLKTDLLDLLS